MLNVIKLYRSRQGKMHSAHYSERIRQAGEVGAAGQTQKGLHMVSAALKDSKNTPERIFCISRPSICPVRKFIFENFGRATKKVKFTIK